MFKVISYGIDEQGHEAKRVKKIHPEKKVCSWFFPDGRIALLKAQTLAATNGFREVEKKEGVLWRPPVANGESPREIHLTVT